jgi:hypothetical protein
VGADFFCCFGAWLRAHWARLMEACQGERGAEARLAGSTLPARRGRLIGCGAVDGTPGGCDMRDRPARESSRCWRACRLRGSGWARRDLDLLLGAMRLRGCYGATASPVGLSDAAMASVGARVHMAVLTCRVAVGSADVAGGSGPSATSGRRSGGSGLGGCI